MKNLTKTLLALGMLCLASTSARAVAIYTYTGNPYSCAFAPYSESMGISGSITLADSLGSNLELASVAPVSFSFFDGVRTITEAALLPGVFQFSTDQFGQIIGWAVEIGLYTGQENIFSYKIAQTEYEHTVSGGQRLAFTSGKAGQWQRVSPPPAQVPDSGSSLGLLWMSVTGLFVAARLWKPAVA